MGLVAPKLIDCQILTKLIQLNEIKETNSKTLKYKSINRMQATKQTKTLES